MYTDIGVHRTRCPRCSRQVLRVQILRNCRWIGRALCVPEGTTTNLTLVLDSRFALKYCALHCRSTKLGYWNLHRDYSRALCLRSSLCNTIRCSCKRIKRPIEFYSYHWYKRESDWGARRKPPSTSNFELSEFLIFIYMVSGEGATFLGGPYTRLKYSCWALLPLWRYLSSYFCLIYMSLS